MGRLLATLASVLLGPAPTPAPPSNDDHHTAAGVRLLFGGDANLNNTLATSELADPWRGLQPAIRAADLFLVNSESTATDRPLSQKANPSGKPECDDTNLLPKGCTKDLRIGTKIAPSFKAGGVDFVALSNNHQVKYGGLNGSEGVRDTMRAFADLAHAGIGETAEQAAAPSKLSTTTAAGDPATVSVYPLCAGPGSSFGTLHPAEVALPRHYDCEAGGADSAPGAMDAQVRLARPGLPGQNLRNLSDATIAEYAGKVKAAAAQGELVVVFLHCKSPALPTTRAIPRR